MIRKYLLGNLEFNLTFGLFSIKSNTKSCLQRKNEVVEVARSK
jgi:hypothetical protein